MNDFPHIFSGSDSLASVLGKPLSGLVVPATDSGSCPRTGTAGSRCNRKWDQSESSPMSPFLWLAGTPTWIQREGRQGPTFKAGRSGNLANVRLLAKPLPSLLCNRNSIDETEEYGISVIVLYHFLSLSSLTRIVFVSEFMKHKSWTKQYLTSKLKGWLSSTTMQFKSPDLAEPRRSISCPA